MAHTLLLSTRKGLFIARHTGQHWNIAPPSFIGENVTLTHVDARDGSWYAALNLGHFGVKLKRSTDAGATWTELAVPAYPEGETVVTRDGKPDQPAKLQLLWSLASGGAEQPGRLWAGTIPGGLFRSDDHGQNWELNRPLWDMPERKHWFGGGYDFPGIHSICVDPRDANTIRIAISCGGVWSSTDGGQSWHVTCAGMRAGYMPPELQYEANAQDPHRMVQCAAHPDTHWVQHHSGVFVSRDACQNWEELLNIEPSVFGFAVAVHPLEPQTAWLVPAVKDECRVPVAGRLVVTRTRDGGKSFETLGNGLPTEHCFDLIYRHSLAVDDSGNALAFGSTTGGVWFSANQGDTWHELPARFPPIHAVQFVPSA
jgi:photosystem II stability/assembly factor-like uncharacterized protein